jgi:hypothetical protein
MEEGGGGCSGLGSRSLNRMRRARTRPTPTENGDALGVGPARVRRLAGGRGRAAHAAKQHGVGARAGSQRGRGQVLAARVPCRPADQSGC